MQDQEFNQFLAEMRPRLHRYCARMTGSAIDGDDVVQDVFLKAIVASPAPPNRTPDRQTLPWASRPGPGGPPGAGP
jgi:DNA-directed RNA polymerase specialized sigma24 family protein